MNPAHLHLILVHFPIASSFLALPLLVWALLRRAELGATAAAALVLVLGGTSAVLALQTGEGAEETIEGAPGVSEALIHEHEERAEVAMSLSVGTGIVGLLGVGLAWAGRKRLAMAGLGVALAADVATAGAMAWTGNAGGMIRHPEIAGEGPTASTAGEAGEHARSPRVREPKEEGERDDD